MIKSGGILGIIAGVFAIIASIVTLFVGGLGSAFHSNSGETVVGLGWGGILFSFLVIILSSIGLSKPKKCGWLLIIASILGMIFGGTLVAIFMILSIVSGILMIIGGKKSQVNEQEKPEETKKGKKKTFLYVLIAIVVIIFIIIAIPSKNSGNHESKIEKLATSQVSDLQPNGKLSDIFSLGSEYTDIQRENTEKEIKGSVVAWVLPVYEVRKDGDNYTIQTSSSSSQNLVGTFITVTPRNENDKNIIESLKTGSYVKVKGVISGVSMRNIEIEPAIIIQ